MRSRESEFLGGVYDEGVTGQPRPRIVKAKHLTIEWGHSEERPLHLLAGYTVVVYTGDDPNDTDSYLVEPARVGPTERRVVVTLRPKTSVSVQAAVQTRYTSGAEGSWRVLGGAVVADPDTVTVATETLSNVPDGSVVSKLLAPEAVTAPKVAPAAIATQHLLLPPSDNLVPNGYSEAGTAALGLSPEGDFLVEDLANAREGRWCRRVPLNAPGYRTAVWTKRIPCSAGDEFSADAWVKVSAPLSGNYGGGLYLFWTDASGNYAGANTSTPLNGVSTSYQRFKVKGACPAGCTGVLFVWELAVVAADVGKAVYLDALSLRRSVTFDLLSANTLQTSNYAEDGSGIPVAGAKLDNVGVALKVASQNLQVGRYPLEALFYKGLVTLDGPGPGNRCFYRGNNQGAVRGGAPNIDRLRVECADNITTSTLSWATWQLFLQPQSLDDNLDGLRYARVELWVRPTAGSAYRQQVLHVALTDRVYQDAAESSANNQARASLQYMFAGSVTALSSTTTSVWYLLVSIVNAYGPSAAKWFTPVTIRNTALGSQYASPVGAGTPDGGGGGGGSDGGGYCPAPWEPILMDDGSELPAELVQPGMRVLTQHEASLKLDAYQVAAVQRARARRHRLLLEDGRGLVASSLHPLFVEGAGWTALNALRTGDVLLGSRPGRVLGVEEEGEGDVVRLTVHGARTYNVQGLLSHNAKPRE
ncbi:Hint domain-containing protein [Myxococcus sp. K38C18041901]|uniref:Hint domain-containing protein n=1 Tax=Myxococcus guangdongensis TaxID=2906760 RepID=UPI0020A7DA90|nr:Hint domain-containing protein [Myxococcus guangdongensis]MCP3065726.1 Hint domain-containing protein [Myxococcus guangdongensis]